MSANRGKSPQGAVKKACPSLKVKAGSAVVPIYRAATNSRLRYTLSFYRDGRRMRKMFNDLESAKKEALFATQRIQSGMQQVTDLKPHRRDTIKAAEAMLEKFGIPFHAAPPPTDAPPFKNPKPVRRSHPGLRSSSGVGGEVGSTIIIHQSLSTPTDFPSRPPSPSLPCPSEIG